MPELVYDSLWEEIRPLVVEKEEFKALDSEEERVIVFDKVVRRLKEKRAEEKRYREREGSVHKRDRRESSPREGSVRRRDRDDSPQHRRDSKTHRRYEEDDRGREGSRLREASQDRRDRDYGYRDRRDEDSRQSQTFKRRSDEDLHPGDRKVLAPLICLGANKQRRREVLDYGEKEDGEVSEEGEIPD
jgi:hypothetical protein